MKTLRSKLASIILCAVIMSLFASCGERAAHCYLCQGIPYEAPCLVDLSSGDVVPLNVRENDDAISIQILGNARIEQRPGEACAIIPTAPREVNADLFCENCLALIESTPNSGYVLADLRDLDSIRLHSIESGKSILIRNYDVSCAAEGDCMKVIVTVQKQI